MRSEYVYLIFILAILSIIGAGVGHQQYVDSKVKLKCIALQSSSIVCKDIS